MATPMAAWRNLDGTYTLRTMHLLQEPPGDRSLTSAEQLRHEIRESGGDWDASPGDWLVPESALDRLGAYRIFIAILAGYCCAPVSCSEVRTRDLERGKVFRVYCPRCGQRAPSSTLWEVPIIEFCGEGEEGRRTYEAAFQAEVEGR